MWEYAGTTTWDETVSEHEEMAEEDGAEFHVVGLEIPDDDYRTARPGSGLNKSGETTPHLVQGKGKEVRVTEEYRNAL